MMYANGDIYNGNWDENLPNGQGNLLCATGLSYVGQFAMGQVRTSLEELFFILILLTLPYF